MGTHDSVIRWADKVADHDFAAAFAYLSLHFTEKRATKLEALLRKAPLTKRRANDLVRATGQSPLTIDDPGVRHTLTKTVSGEELSPILVVSFEVGAQIADGWHRLSTAYCLNPFSDVPCCIADCHD
jgi:hypothetical protein